MEGYTSQQFALGAGLAAVLVLIAVLVLPWYTTSISIPGFGGMSESAHGTDKPFRGTAQLVLALLAGVAAALYAFGFVPHDLVRITLALSAVLFVIAAVLALLDVFRDMPSISAGPSSAGKSIGPYASFLFCLAGAGMAFGALRRQAQGG